MTLNDWLQRSVLVSACLFGAAGQGVAQITTGSIAGTVKDVQGGVIPGATVTLISDSQGTKTPVVTDATGDFVFVNIRPDTYTGEVTMPSFRTLRRTGGPGTP